MKEENKIMKENNHKIKTQIRKEVKLNHIYEKRLGNYSLDQLSF